MLGVGWAVLAHKGRWQCPCPGLLSSVWLQGVGSSLVQVGGGGGLGGAVPLNSSHVDRMSQQVVGRRTQSHAASPSQQVSVSSSPVRTEAARRAFKNEML